jgi:rfaE bifunctional protein nucleotidyltransferase chain/domain
MGRVMAIGELREARDKAKREDKIFVFTNGCFDILHRGHIELLKVARGLGDMLAVGLNSDTSVRRLKGQRRPIMPQDDRAVVLASLESVDFVTLFDEDTPERIIAVLKPDILVKGSDYALSDIVGRRQVEDSGGRVVRIGLYGDYSTEKVLRGIAARYKDTET